MGNKTFYPYAGMNTSLHIIELQASRTLCGIEPPMSWEMSFQGEVYPEVGSFVENHFSAKRPGFEIGRSFAPDRYFCKRCYASLKRSVGVNAIIPA